MKPLRLMLASASALSLMAAPASLAAQDANDTIVIESMPQNDDPGGPSNKDQELAGLAALMGGMAEVEPLTAEQQARLPAAEGIIARIWPVGASAELSQNLFGEMLSGFDTKMSHGAKAGLATSLGVSPLDLQNLSDAQAAEAMTLFDPAWEQREIAVNAMVPEFMRDITNLVEPPMRRAMIEVYAIRFTAPELAEINAFFATDTGAKYARQSLSMASDRRLMAATMEAMPAMFAMIGQMEERMKARIENLPAPRSFADLSPEERAKVAQLTGYAVEEIEANLAVDAAMAPTGEAITD